MLKNRAIAQKLGSVMFAGLMVLTAGVAAAAAPASATTDCTSWMSKDEINNAPDRYRAGAACTDIESDHEVRAQLIRENAPDRYSVYFTTENKSYRTDWYICPDDCTHGYQVRNR